MEQYNFVLSNGIQLAESVILKPSSNTSELPVSSQFNHLKGSKPWLFEMINLPLQPYSLHTPDLWQQQQSDLLAQHPHLQCHKLSETRILIDLSQLLVGHQQPVDKPLLMVCVDQKLAKVVLNTVFKCSIHEDRVKTLFCLRKSATIPNGLAHIVELVLEVCRPFYLQSLNEDQHEGEELCKSVHNSQKLSIQVQPTNVYAILEAQKAQLRSCSSPGGSQPFELVFPQPFTQEKHDEEDGLSDISDFETIQMEEFEGEKEEVAIQKQMEVPMPAVEVCEQCGDKQDAKTGVMVSMLDYCGHRYCSCCLTASCMNQLELTKSPIKCLNSVCECEVPLDLLQMVLALPVANYAASLYHLTAQLDIGKVVSECTSCHDLVAVDSQGDFGQLCCTKCKVHWCVYCRKQPHWPLKCAQAKEWSKKFEQQYQLDRQRAVHALVTPLPSPSNPIPSQQKNENKVCKRGITQIVDQLDQKRDDLPSCTLASQSAPQHNTIAQQFSLICSESRARRLDTKTGWQLAKNIRRLTTSQPAYKWQSQFVDVRKTALHLLEYGYAWLYMNRVQNSRPQEWPQIKVMLCSLRRKVEALDSELLFSSSLTDAIALVEKLKKVEQLVDKIIEKFLAEPTN